MTSLAFIISPTPRVAGFLHRNNILVSSKSGICRQQQRRIRITNQNLYPEVDPPESIPNPLNQNNQNKKSNESEEPFLKKLNDRTAQKQATDTSATTLDNLTTDTESAASKAAGAMDYSSATLTPEQPLNAKSNYMPAARALWRLGWFSWWVQLILSVIAGVILLFSFAFPGVNVRSSASALGFVLSGVGVFIGFISLFWTYSYTRLSLWLERGKGTAEQARSRISNRLRFGVLFSLAGLLVSLVGLQAIVGTLLARLFGAGIATTPYTAYQTGPSGTAGGLVPGLGIVQPVDILVIQACANAMMALMTALVATAWLRSREKMWNKESKVQ